MLLRSKLFAALLILICCIASPLAIANCDNGVVINNISNTALQLSLHHTPGDIITVNSNGQACLDFKGKKIRRVDIKTQDSFEDYVPAWNDPHGYPCRTLFGPVSKTQYMTRHRKYTLQFILGSKHLCLGGSFKQNRVH